MDTTQTWLAHFKQNARRTLECPDDGYRMTPEERRAIASSIQAFHIGEASEGKSLKASAEEFARQTGNEDYVETIVHLIREENRHSAYLGAFMKQQGIASKARTWTDGIFRVIRRLAGIETNIRVLVTAELIALTYYDVLGKATGSRLLSRICARMLEEEREHVAFQMHHVHWMNFRKFPLFSALSDLAHAILLAGTLVAVWMQHRRVLRGAYDFRGFCAKVWGDFRDTMDAGRESALRELLGAEAFERMEEQNELKEAV